MVCFSCNACGDTVKKNQVEKHLFRCRSCTVLSCLDCCKDFHGEEYQVHVKCISEEEKYSGKGYKPKDNADKGEKKQGEWVAALRQKITTANVKEPLRRILERLATFDNIPRKQKKFENFTRQCVSVNDARLIKDAWNIVSEAFEASKKPSNEPAEVAKPENLEEGEQEAKKLNKKERKLARQRKTKVEKKDAREAPPAPAAEDQMPEDEEPSRKRKRKHKANGEETPANGHDTEEANHANGTKKRKKNKHKDRETQQEQEEPVPKRARGGESGDAAVKAEKFKWSEIVKSLLQAADEQEISLKKLKKKVVAEYMSRGYSKPTTKEQVEVKLLKKVQRNPEFKLHKERVRLVT